MCLYCSGLVSQSNEVWVQYPLWAHYTWFIIEDEDDGEEAKFIFESCSAV